MENVEINIDTYLALSLQMFNLEKTINSQPLTEEMDIDVYTNRETGQISIFYGKELRKVLEYIEFHEDTLELLFVYIDEIQSFGPPMQLIQREHFLKAETVGIYQLDLVNHEVINGTEIPLVVKTSENTYS